MDRSHEDDRAVRRGDLPYRACVGVALFDALGRVWVGRRNDVRPDAWQMPQGGIDAGETPRAAGYRELEEEIGVRPDKVEFLAETADWLTYDLPDRLLGIAWKGRYRGQKQKWLALRFLGRDGDIVLETDHPEFDAGKWVALETLPDLIVAFKRPVYRQVVAAFRHLAVPR